MALKALNVGSAEVHVAVALRDYEGLPLNVDVVIGEVKELFDQYELCHDRVCQGAELGVKPVARSGVDFRWHFWS